MFKSIRKGFSAWKGGVGSQLSASHDSFLAILIGIIVILGPLFFIPMRGFSVGIAKGFFFLGIGALIIIASGIQMLRRGAFTIPRGWAFVFLAAMLGTALLGSIISGAFTTSIIGYGFETTTWVFMVLFAILVVVGYGTMRSYNRIGVMMTGLLVPFFLLALFHIVRYFVGPIFGNFGVLVTNISTLIGSWGDLAMFFGFILIASVLSLELGGFKKPIRIVVGSAAALSVIVLAFMNVRSVWTVIGLIALLVTLYLFSFAYWDRSEKEYAKDRRAPGYAIALFVISLICVVFGGLFQGWANRYQNISWSESRPSFMMTVRTGAVSFMHNPVTGYGPNLFNAAWNKAKPPALSGMATNFVQGYGWVPTQIATQGIFGIVAWIGFFVVVLGAVIRSLIQGFNHPFERYVRVLVGFSVIYLSIMAWTTILGSYLIALLALFIGITLGLQSGDVKKVSEYSFIKDPRTSFFGIVGVLIIIIAGLLAAYFGVRKFVSFVHYSKAAAYLDQGARQKASQEVAIAAVWANHDQYHADLAQFALSDISQLASTANAGQSVTLSKQMEQILGAALGHAQAAINGDPLSYTNRVLLGNVYQVMTELGIEGSADRARAAYEEAAKRNPNDSTNELLYARVDVAQKNNSAAAEKVKASINKYPTSAAYISQAQLYINSNNMSLAITSLENAIALDPYNVELTYQYGLLLFTQKQYQSAIAAFLRVVSLNRSAGVAYVYLGVSYEKVGDMENANAIYDYVRKQWTDGAQAISQVKSGMIETPAPEAAVDSKTDTKKTDTKTVAPTVKKQ